jgi:copper homeostasis protein
MPQNILLEVCAESVESAVEAGRGGASRVELCRNLSKDGLTPTPEMVRNARRLLHIPLHVLIRPREGDFVYSEAEIDGMVRDIANAKASGADGVVVGVLKRDRTVDEDRLARLVDLARPMKVTFHRAFDACSDRFNALEFAIRIGVTHVLTSGGEITAERGVGVLRGLVAKASGRISIIAAAGISAINVQQIVKASGVTEVHAGRGVSRPLQEGSTSASASPAWKVDASLVRELLNQAQDPGGN